MNGGLIEGLKKIYTGSNAWKIHLWIFGLTLVMSIIICYTGAQIEVPAGKTLNELMFLEYFITQDPISGIILLIAILLLCGYMFNTINNMIKFFSLKQPDEEGKNYDIFPNLNIIEILKVLPKFIVVLLLWIIYLTIFTTICLLASAIIKVKLFKILLWIAFVIVCNPIFPIVLTKFSENYEIKSVANPLFAINILKNTFLPVWWLTIKAGLLNFLTFVIAILIAFILAIFFRFLGKLVIDCIVGVIICYTASIIQFAYYYGCANIYNKKLKNSEEELA